MTPPPASAPPKLPDCAHVPEPYAGPSAEEVLRLRQEHLSPSLFLYYQRPLMLVEGRGQYVWDEQGRRYLDGFGGIVTVSVGHCHPKVVAAANAQNSRIQHTSTIYLHPNIAAYAQALAARMPPGLSVCYFVNSGSEANDLALLMARAYTGNFDVIALRNSYHGGVTGAMGLTSHHTWKYAVPHGFGVQFAQCPDPYRGPYGYDDESAGPKYARDIESLIHFATPGQIAAFVHESVQGVGGYVVFPKNYLRDAYAITRAAGGVCIADEVQAGFARCGSHYWGFETHGVVPDIVTMAKGIGNGCALAAVVTRPEIAQALTQRIHFNTFGGDPVATAQGKAVLDVIEEEGLQARAAALGARFFAGLRRLQQKHDLIGDIRGHGLLIGIDLVEDRRTKTPARDAAARVMESARDLGLIIGKGGLRGNVLRLTPPLCLGEADVDFALDALDQSMRMA